MQARRPQQARSNYAAPNEHTITSLVSRHDQTGYEQLLQSMTSANEYINLLQYTLIIIEKNRTLANEARARFSEWVFSLLYRKLCSLTHNERSHLQARHLATTLHRLGKILSRSSSRNTKVQANHLNLVINCLSQLSDLGVQEIANSLYGIGQIVAANRLNGMIDVNHLNQFLMHLLQLHNLETQHIANALYGIGKIAAANKFNGMINVNHLNQLLICLPQLPNLKTQHIANSLYGIGQITATDKLSGLIDVNYLNQLLISLSQLPDLDAQGIANSLYGISQIAATDKFNGMIDANHLNQILIFLPQLPNLKTQDVANTLYGIGQIAAADKFNGMIDANHLNQLLICLPQLPDLDTQGIANSLYGIGQISATNKFNGLIDANHLNQLLICLPQLTDLGTQGIANSLYGIGQMAATDKFNGLIDVNHLNQLLMHLLQLHNLEPQHIANTLYGIGHIAAAGNINKLPDQHLIIHLITSQACHHFNTIAIHQITQALAFLGMTIPQDFLTRLMTKKPTIISNYQHTAINILKINLADTDILPEHLIDSWFVDIYFEYRGKKYILELDGSHHYINGELRSEDALRDKHFEKKGYHVIRIKNEDLSEQVLLDYINTDIKPENTGTGLFSSSSTLFSWSAFRNELRLNAPAPESDQRNNWLS